MRVRVTVRVRVRVTVRVRVRVRVSIRFRVRVTQSISPMLMCPLSSSSGSRPIDEGRVMSKGLG